MRTLLAALLFTAVSALTVNTDLAGQVKKQPNKKAKGQYDPPAAKKPDDATMKQIAAKTEQLLKAVAALKEKKIPSDVFIEVAIYLKAADSIVRFEEWYHANSGKWALQTLDQGLERAKQAEGGKALWRDAPGKWVVRAYRSRIDGSIQPYAVLLPHDYGKDPKKRWRLDIVLHGRDSSLTEAKFIAMHNGNAPMDRDYIQLEPYGRGNNAYRWAGEEDVFEAWGAFSSRERFGTLSFRPVLRGFSMGGAGTWHIGLHYPGNFCVIGPGAGFTTTHGYIANLPKHLPEYQEKCLHIYDAVDYVENAFNVPIVAYSGEIDAQKKAADNIENLLKNFNEPVKFTHLVAPGLAHQMPKEWQDKAETEYRKHAHPDKDLEFSLSSRIRAITYTPRYGMVEDVVFRQLERQYEKAVIDFQFTQNGASIKTANVAQFEVRLSAGGSPEKPRAYVIDGQPLELTKRVKYFLKSGGKWSATFDPPPSLAKVNGIQGPIDDAFMWRYVVVGPEAEGWHTSVNRHVVAELAQFGKIWDKYFRGVLPITKAEGYYPDKLRRYETRPTGVALFGDPQSNPLIAKVLPKLPITWTKEKLVANGVEYDPKTHVPILIYPNPLTQNRSYVVLNSGHTFKEADLKGTNALLYPRLGDWAVIKPTPTRADPAAYEVVAAGLFDENWQFTGPVAEGAKLEKLWGDGEFTEGPAEGPDGCIYFSDIGNRIMKFDPKTGRTTAFRDPGGRSNGLKFDAMGRLVACEGANTGGGRRISITEKDGTVKTLADKFEGKRFNSPNDLTLDARGRIYFSDPRYVGEEKRELDHESVYRVDPDGTVTRLTTDTTKPNGLVISPDGKTLYVAESNGGAKGKRHLLAYPLKEDGTLGERKVLYDFGAERGIDGMTVTKDGVIVATAGSKENAGVWFFDPSGKKLAVLKTPEDPSNCCFAGADKKTLYVTAGKSLYRVKLTIVGHSLRE